MKVCPKCGSINSDGSNNCTKCGSPLGNSIHRPSSQNINGGQNAGNVQRPVQQPQRPVQQPQRPVQQPQRPVQQPQRPVQQPQSRQGAGGVPPRNPSNGGSNSKTIFGIIGGVVAIFIIGLIVMLASNTNMTDSEIDDNFGSGVVLIMNSGYYEVVLSNGESVYFSSYDEEDGLQNFTFDKDSIVTATSFGTGFFVTNDGKIATNNHVVASEVTEKQVRQQMKSVFQQIKEALSEKYNEYKQYDEQLIATIRQKYLYDQDYSEEYAISDALEDEMEKLKGLYNYISNINPSESELNYHSSVSVAYNNTYVTSTSDFIPCVVKSTDPDYDLALIQLKDKKTPSDKHIFDVPYSNPLEDYSATESIGKNFGKDKNSKLTMIGFNKGPQLAFTQEGIKAQCTSGSISQNDSEKIMYTIPSLHGSSGSPVINARGQLVAVNFAGIDVTQSFNYGVKVKHLRNLLDK